MSVQLNPRINVGPGIWGQRNWVSYISGHWNGRWGKGTVVVSLLFSSCHGQALALNDMLIHGAIAWWTRFPTRGSGSFHPSR